MRLSDLAKKDAAAILDAGFSQDVILINEEGAEFPNIKFFGSDIGKKTDLDGHPIYGRFVEGSLSLSAVIEATGGTPTQKWEMKAIDSQMVEWNYKFLTAPIDRKLDIINCYFEVIDASP